MFSVHRLLPSPRPLSNARAHICAKHLRAAHTHTHTSSAVGLDRKLRTPMSSHEATGPQKCKTTVMGLVAILAPRLFSLRCTSYCLDAIIVAEVSCGDAPVTTTLNMLSSSGVQQNQAMGDVTEYHHNSSTTTVFLHGGLTDCLTEVCFGQLNICRALRLALEDHCPPKRHYCMCRHSVPVIP